MVNSLRKLKYKIPVRLRHYWRLVATSITFVALLALVAGSGMIRPYSSSPDAAAAEVVIDNIEGTVDLFDSTVAHSVEISFAQSDYEAMLTEYRETGEKQYLPADITIDGVTIKDVGIRLKGNSTLMSLSWNGERLTTAGRGGGGGRQMPEGMEPPEGMELPEGMEPPGGAQQPGGGQPPEGQGGMGGMTAELKAEEPETLPWLIKIDEYVDGRRYQGLSQLAVRPATTENSTQLSEALAIALVEQSGEPSQRFTYGGFNVNGRASGPRLILDYLDTGYAESLGNGVLYKSLSTGQFSYQGQDQTEYTTDFKQINNLGSQDLQPVIDLLQWVQEASDAEFARKLDDYVDVESFARYVALQNLLLNFDDMAGPGKNFYLWYDLDTRTFTVISWDLNFAFGGDTATGPDDELSMAGGFGPGGGAEREQRTMPEGMPDPPEGMDEQESRMGGNKLKERFLETAAFDEIYEQAYWELYDQLYANGTATALADGIANAYLRNAGADQAGLDSERSTLKTKIDERTKALADQRK